MEGYVEAVDADVAGKAGIEHSIAVSFRVPDEVVSYFWPVSLAVSFLDGSDK